MQTINNWKEFIHLVEELVGKSPRSVKYLFRGQSDVSWGLLPSFSRLAQGNTIRWALDREYHMQRIFRLDAHNHLQEPILPSHTNQLELWWSVMQHYGVSTRLLDWSCSPYVALYFAVSDLGDNDASFWLVHPNTVNGVADNKYKKNQHKFIDLFVQEDTTNLVSFYEPAVKTDRMLSQQGWFSVCANSLQDHSEAIWSDCGYENNTLVKFKVPATQKKEFLKQLNFMNITARTIYPGLDGLGKSVQEYLKLEAS